MAAAECISVNISNTESDEIKKLKEVTGDNEANAKTQDSPAAEGAPETNTENSNTESSEPPASNDEVCEEDQAAGNEELECDERMNGHKVEEDDDEECCDEEDECEDSNGASEECSNDADECVATKRQADDEEEPAKKLCTENENSE